MNIWKISEFFLKYLIHKYQFSLLCSELKEYSYKSGYYVSIMHIFDFDYETI